MVGYDPLNWYWLADDGRLFGSARGGLVTGTPTRDEDFAVWSGSERQPTAWPRDASGKQTDAALEEVLAPCGAHVTLSGWQADLKAQIDTKAEDIRLTLITPGSGQAMEYQEAYAQAQAALSATGTVEPADYPMLAVTIGVDIDPKTGKPAVDVLGVARSVKAAYEAYLQAGAAIRGVRLLAKAELEAAPDADHARAVFAAIKWPTFG